MPRIALVTVLLLITAAAGMAEPCNPVIDGTHCATNMGAEMTVRLRADEVRRSEIWGGD